MSALGLLAKLHSHYQAHAAVTLDGKSSMLAKTVTYIPTLVVLILSGAVVVAP